MERETGFEPATNSLEGCDSTPELLPPGVHTTSVERAQRTTTTLSRAKRRNPPRDERSEESRNPPCHPRWIRARALRTKSGGRQPEPSAPPATSEARSWWRRMDSNHRRAEPGRFTVCCLCPLGYASGSIAHRSRCDACQRAAGVGRRLEPALGLEPRTYCLQGSCSTTELCRPARAARGTARPALGGSATGASRVGPTGPAVGPGGVPRRRPRAERASVPASSGPGNRLPPSWRSLLLPLRVRVVCWTSERVGPFGSASIPRTRCRWTAPRVESANQLSLPDARGASGRVAAGTCGGMRHFPTRPARWRTAS
jgi:hypothetical protein